MSKRENGTLRAGARLGLNPYGWGNGRGQAMQAIKKARRRQPVRAVSMKRLYFKRKGQESQDGKDIENIYRWEHRHGRSGF